MGTRSRLCCGSRRTSPRCAFTLTKKVAVPAAILFRSILMAAARISASGAPTNVAFPPSPIHLVTAFSNDSQFVSHGFDLTKGLLFDTFSITIEYTGKKCRYDKSHNTISIPKQLIRNNVQQGKCLTQSLQIWIWPSTQITLFERTRQSAWLDAVTTPLIRSEWILVY